MRNDRIPASITLTEVLKRRFEATETEVHGYLSDAMEALAVGDADEVRVNLRSIVRGTMGYTALAEETGISKRSLHRRLSETGNPSLSNLAVILSTLLRHLGLAVSVSTVPNKTAAE